MQIMILAFNVTNSAEILCIFKAEVTWTFNSTWRAASPTLLEKNNIFNWAFDKWPGLHKGRFLALLEMKTI